jgi:site-specific recombinase XerD
VARQTVPSAHPFAIIRDWQAWLEVSGRANAETRRQYKRYLLGFLADVTIDPLDVTKRDIWAWAQQASRQGATYGQTVRALKSFYRFAKREHLVKKNPAKAVEIPRSECLPPPMTSDEDLERFFAAAERVDPRARPTLELMFATGARIGSVAAAESKDVDLVRNVIHWRVAKNDDPYKSYLGKRGRRAAARLLELGDYMPPKVARRRATLVGVGAGRLWQWVDEASRSSGVDVWPHRLRHEFCHRVANDPAIPDFVASSLMNHKDPRQLKVYALPFEELGRQGVEDL